MSVRIIHGANDGHWPFAGKTIAEIRRQLKDIYNFPSASIAWVNGKTFNETTALRDGDNLEFGNAVGEKGGSPDFVTESEIRHQYGDDGFKRMMDAGLQPSMQVVFSSHDVAAFGRTLCSNELSRCPVPFSVDVERETLNFGGKEFQCDRTVALVLKCLIDARGEIRSTGDIKRAFPDEPWEERLDLTINRKLIPHVSGVGGLVESVRKRGYRLRNLNTE